MLVPVNKGPKEKPKVETEKRPVKTSLKKRIKRK